MLGHLRLIEAILLDFHVVKQGLNRLVTEMLIILLGL